MFARKVAARLKPNTLTEFTNLMEREILPWLRNQEGFLDLITLAAADGSEVTTISFWEQPGSAQTYNANGYPQVLMILEKLLDSAPYVKTFNVVSTTFRNPARTPLLEGQQLLQDASSAHGECRELA
jgi:hypothetical protein